MSPVASVVTRRAGRPRREGLAARYDALLETALGLFIAHGYANVSLLMVARAARVAIRTIYLILTPVETPAFRPERREYPGLKAGVSRRDLGGDSNPFQILFRSTGLKACRTSIVVKFGGKPGLLDAAIATERRRHRSELNALGFDTLDVHARFERLVHHLARRCARPDLIRLQAIVAAEADPRAAQSLHAAGPGQAMPVLRAALSQAGREGCLRRDLTLDQLCAHFFSCVCGSYATLCAPDDLTMTADRCAVKARLRRMGAIQ